MVPKVIAYKVYQEVPLVGFPNLKSMIYVKPDIYDKWKENSGSVNFRDVLIDPENR